jgi:hypothetical protein
MEEEGPGKGEDTGLVLKDKREETGSEICSVKIPSAIGVANTTQS